MDDNPGARQEAAPFRAVLTPHRSLGPKGFLIVMGLVGAVSFIAGVAFLLMGAWPVTGFLGLDVALIYLAFKLNYRSGRLHETVEVDCEALTVVRVHPSGRREAFAFNPMWVRLQLREGWDGRTELRLTHHERSLTFARFLTDDERRDFAGALSGALVAVRGGARI